ncbi:hypothetical protein SYNPS1DRAFT_21557 [Syncephalis pseudoplumigaleata]|uniref:Defective in cullin neddylation protein n=1 Tax=Syncephalis pseudoplumigaleata TaxID=1712513 RepID=A0A4P9Z4H0_9FUNG|nr:hypothetical protein SYNPS1DRAFT_21557 [Syncephalis pseudoplumigaleata]|eukprot:RKP26741.1 hypothetical protein SYNPS1DRAFT_21557 [Syncephalis pseudoplumigaleata]
MLAPLSLQFGKNKVQKEKIQTDETVHPASESVASQLLKANNWNLDVAADAYYNQPGAVTAAAASAGAKMGQFVESRLQQVFDQYKDADEPDKILLEGTERYCADLEVAPDDVLMLVIATHLKAKMCEFPRQTFIQGWRELR